LLSEVDDYVNTYAGEDNAQQEWERILKTHNVQKKTENIVTRILEEVEKYLQEFSKQLDFEIKNLNFDKLDISEIDKPITGRVARWSSAGLTATSGTMILGGLLNWWNPVGWIVTAVGIGGLVAGVFSWIWGNDTKRYEKKKSTAKKVLKSNIEKAMRTANREVKGWFYENITHLLKKKLKVELKGKLNTLRDFNNSIREIVEEINNEIDSENIALFIKVFDGYFKNDFFEKSIVRVCRIAGSISKILISDLPEQSFNIKIMRKLLGGEQIYFVLNDSNPITLLKNALAPALISEDEISFIEEHNKYIIQPKNSEISKIIGKNGNNIKLTSNLLKTKIEILK
jgi:hypothetical protein